MVSSSISLCVLKLDSTVRRHAIVDEVDKILLFSVFICFVVIVEILVIGYDNIHVLLMK